MNPTQFQRLKALFDTLAELPASERRAHLENIADIDADTRRRLHALLDAHAEIGDTPTHPAVRSDALDARHFADGKIGAYRIERELGSGGMGSVFLAHRTEGGVDQRVAIKIVRPDVLGADTLARFRLERQVLALLRHPNIAAMLDVGELDDGSPYVVMEYVDGVPITVFARGIDLKRRLALFLDVCDAVAYAHRNMVVHRDIKPSNLLVEAQGRAKLLDFGIAKPLIERLGAVDVEHTGTAQRFFSLYNAAPEQLGGEAITVACDVYGLGALLYELVAGKPAFAFDGLTPAQIETRIRETEPAPPSSVAPLDRDVDAIVLRCLRKQPEQRYASVDALRDDIERYLSKRPVLARRGQWLYRAGRFFSRHRLGVAAASIVAAVLIASGVLTWHQYRAAIDERVRAEAVTSFILDTIEAADPDKRGGEDVSVRQLVGQVGSRAARELTDQPIALARLTEALVAAQLALGNADDAAALLENARGAVAAVAASDAATATRFALLAARVKFDSGDTQGADDVLRDIEPRLAGANDHLLWATLKSRIPHADGKIIAVREALRSAYDRWLDQPGVTPATRWEAREALAATFDTEGLSAPALALYESNLAEQRASLASGHPAIIRTLLLLVQMKRSKGDDAGANAAGSEAVDLIKRIYGTRSTVYARALQEEAMQLLKQGENEQGIKVFDESLRIHEDILGAHHPALAAIHFNLAGALEKKPAYRDVAERHFLATATIADATLPPAGLKRMYLIGVPGSFEARIGNYDKAIELLEPLVRNASEDVRQRDIYGFVYISLLFSRYGRHPSAENTAALKAELDATNATEFSPVVADGYGVLRRRIDEVLAANAARTPSR